MRKDNDKGVSESFAEYIKHISSSYSPCSIILEPRVAADLHLSLAAPVYTILERRPEGAPSWRHKVDLASTLGGDGTILHASSLFADSPTVPPILAFSMGTLGFLGEWKFKEYKKAFREVYVSGAKSGLDPPELQNDGVPEHKLQFNTLESSQASWGAVRGKIMGHDRNARVLLRSRLKVGIFSPSGERVPTNDTAPARDDVYAMNEVIIHRGQDPHLAIVEVFVRGRFLTEAVADGMIISTPTGSTAYNLSSGGSIVHPLVSSLLLTPICPRSLSFRPLVLPADTPITLRLSKKNRGRKVDVSVDGVRRTEGLSVGMELKVRAEQVQDEYGSWIGGVPSIVRTHVGTEAGSEDNWVGGLNGLLKFNYPMGEE